jgi:hypothetical protein
VKIGLLESYSTTAKEIGDEIQKVSENSFTIPSLLSSIKVIHKVILSIGP